MGFKIGNTVKIKKEYLVVIIKNKGIPEQILRDDFGLSKYDFQVVEASNFIGIIIGKGEGIYDWRVKFKANDFFLKAVKIIADRTGLNSELLIEFWEKYSVDTLFKEKELELRDGYREMEE